MIPLKTPKRVALYARYSTDLQNPKSVDDQIANATEYLSRLWPDTKITDVFSDRAISGKNDLRPGYNALLESIREQRFDAIFAEGLDRLSRKQSTIARLYELSEFYNVPIYTLHEGAVSELHVGLVGTSNAVYLKQLSEKAQRAQRAASLQGRITNGLMYGYRVKLDEKGRAIPGEREIDPEQSKIVERIFKEYAEGKPAKQIANSLNLEGIKTPRGGQWTAAKLLGTYVRGDGILSQQTYKGVYTWGKHKRIKNPETGKVKREKQSQDNQVEIIVEHLRIVSDELWNKVQRRRGALPKSDSVQKSVKSDLKKNKSKQKKSSGNRFITNGLTRPLTTLVKCGQCGSDMHVGNATRYICSGWRYKKTDCTNGRGKKEKELFELLLEDLKLKVSEVENLCEMISLRAGVSEDERPAIEAEILDIEERQQRLVEAITEGVQARQAIEKSIKLEDRYIALKRQLKSYPVPKNSDAAKDYILAGLDRVERVFDFGNQNRTETYLQSEWIHKIFSTVVDQIEVSPLETAKRGVTVKIHYRKHGWPDLYRVIREKAPNGTPK